MQDDALNENGFFSYYPVLRQRLNVSQICHVAIGQIHAPLGRRLLLIKQEVGDTLSGDCALLPYVPPRLVCGSLCAGVEQVGTAHVRGRHCHGRVR